MKIYLIKEDRVQNLKKQYDLLATPDNKEKSSFAQ